MHPYIHTHIHTQTHTRTHARTHIHTLYIYISLSLYTYIYICILVGRSGLTPRSHGVLRPTGSCGCHTLPVFEATNTATKRLRQCCSSLFEQLFELFSVGCLFSSKLFELVRVVVIFVVVILAGPYPPFSLPGPAKSGQRRPPVFGRGDDTVGNPHRAQISQLELFELILLLKLDKQFPVVQFEARVSQSTVPSPLLSLCRRGFAESRIS